MTEYRVFVGGYYKGRTDDEDKLRRIEQNAAWNGRYVSRYGDRFDVRRRR